MHVEKLVENPVNNDYKGEYKNLQFLYNYPNTKSKISNKSVIYILMNFFSSSMWSIIDEE